MDKVRLGDIATFINGDRGKNYPSQADIIANGDVPFVNAGHLNGRSIDFEEMNYISQDKYEQLNSGKFIKGDILYCLRGSLGKKALVQDEIKGAIASSLVIIRPDNKRIESGYLMFALDSPSIKDQLIKANNGSSQPNLSATSVKDYQIELPSIKIQKEVVENLTRARAVIDNRQHEIDLLDQLVKARFVELFGDPIHSDKYNSRKLSSCVKDKGDMVDGPFGSQVNTKVDYIENGEIPVIRTVNVKMMSFSPVDLKYMTRDKYETVIRSQVLPGDVILTKVGTIGNVCVFPDTFEEAVLSTTGSCRIRVDKDVMDTVFFAYNLMYLKDKLLEIASAGVQPFLNMNHVKNIDILDVPLDKQMEFTDFVKQVDKSKVAIQKSLEKTQLLFDSLMQNYFG